MDIETLDPREYTLAPASTKVNMMDTLLEQHFSPLRLLGKYLAATGVLPIEYDCEAQGYCTTGNYSVRAEAGFLITGSNVEKGKLQREGLLYVERVDYDNSTIYCQGKSRPSKEILIHDQIYCQFPEVQAIAHTHDLAALLDNNFPTTNRQIICANLQDAQEVARLISDTSYLNLKDHGQIIIGAGIMEVLDIAISRHLTATKHLYENVFRS